MSLRRFAKCIKKSDINQLKQCAEMALKMKKENNCDSETDES